jgi:hypothetical protein
MRWHDEPQRIFAYTEPTDMRKSFQGFGAQMQRAFPEQDPHWGSLFVFTSSQVLEGLESYRQPCGIQYAIVRTESLGRMKRPIDWADNCDRSSQKDDGRRVFRVAINGRSVDQIFRGGGTDPSRGAVRKVIVAPGFDSTRAFPRRSVRQFRAISVTSILGAFDSEVDAVTQQTSELTGEGGVGESVRWLFGYAVGAISEMYVSV